MADEDKAGAKEEKRSRPRRERKEEAAPQPAAEEKPTEETTPAGKPRRRRAADGSPQPGGGNAGGWMSAPAKPVQNDKNDDISIIPDMNEAAAAQVLFVFFVWTTHTHPCLLNIPHDPPSADSTMTFK